MRTMGTLVLALLATLATSSCCGNQKPATDAGAATATTTDEVRSERGAAYEYNSAQSDWDKAHQATEEADQTERDVNRAFVEEQGDETGDSDLP